MTEIPSDWMPEPTGFHILIEPAQPREQTRGGILLPDQSKQTQEILGSTGKVVAMGPECYRGPKFQEIMASGHVRYHKPWCKLGDSISHGQYGGQQIIIAGPDGQPHKFRVINDDEVLGLVKPESVMTHGV
jgi:co-chaperonin GroES (HSP10)